MKIAYPQKTKRTNKKDGLYFDKNGLYSVKENKKTVLISN